MSITTNAPSGHQAITPVAFDLYRDIHKGVRAELFDLATEAGRLDPDDTAGVTALSGHVQRTVRLLVQHAEHEDGTIQPVIEQLLPGLAGRIARDHESLERRMDVLVALARSLGDADAGARRNAVHELYLELCAFTSSYLAHQDDEERHVMPALEAAIGVDAVMGLHGQIIGAIAPDDLATSIAIMLPAMNIDDRSELLGGIRAGAPAEAFDAMWGLARSVLDPRDLAALAGRIGL